jgi:hypothetical protein
VKKKWWKKNEKLKLKTVPSRFWKAQWQSRSHLNHSTSYDSMKITSKSH